MKEKWGWYLWPYCSSSFHILIKVALKRTHLIDMLVCFDEVHRELAQWGCGRVPKCKWDPSLKNGQVWHDLWKRNNKKTTVRYTVGIIPMELGGKSSIKKRVRSSDVKMTVFWFWNIEPVNQIWASFRGLTNSLLSLGGCGWYYRSHLPLLKFLSMFHGFTVWISAWILLIAGAKTRASKLQDMHADFGWNS